MRVTSSDKISQAFAPLVQNFQRLGKRDQWALLALLLFLVVGGSGYGSFLLHQQANKMQSDYEKNVADFFWLRSQAGNISTTTSATALTADTVKQLLTQAGITGQVVDNAGKFQLSFSHAQASVIGNVLSQLTQQGLKVEQLQITQPTPDKLEVQAVLTK